MRLVERILGVDGESITVEALVEHQDLFCDADGLLSPPALIELLAQSYAAFNGYISMAEGKTPSMGFLVSIKKAEILGQARAGDQLRVETRSAGAFGGFTLVHGQVFRGEELIAQGSLQLWIRDQEPKP
jgi:predicted hotdog family 3-hydroxylacyl-ACP dehydratase